MKLYLSVQILCSWNKCSDSISCFLAVMKGDTGGHGLTAARSREWLSLQLHSIYTSHPIQDHASGRREAESQQNRKVARVGRKEDWAQEGGIQWLWCLLNLYTLLRCYAAHAGPCRHIRPIGAIPGTREQMFPHHEETSIDQPFPSLQNKADTTFELLHQQVYLGRIGL